MKQYLSARRNVREKIRTLLYVVCPFPRLLLATQAAQPGKVHADTDSRMTEAGVAEWLKARTYMGLSHTATVFVQGVP